MKLHCLIITSNVAHKREDIQDTIWGVLEIIPAAVFVSSFTSVYIERILKTDEKVGSSSHVRMWLRNLHLRPAYFLPACFYVSPKVEQSYERRDFSTGTKPNLLGSSQYVMLVVVFSSPV